MKRAALALRVCFFAAFAALRTDQRETRRALHRTSRRDASRPESSAAGRHCGRCSGRRRSGTGGRASASGQSRRRRLLVYYDAKTRGIWTLDFRETAPREATRNVRQETPPPAHVRRAFQERWRASMHCTQKFGAQPWKELLAPAIAVAREGPRDDAGDRGGHRSGQRETQARHRYKASSAGTRNDTAAARRFRAERFLQRQIAKKLIESVRAAGGIFGFRDLHEYEPIWRAPIKLRYGPYEIHTVAPPSGGGLVLGETLNILGGDDLARLGFQTTASLHLLIEAQRRAAIDRARYIGDPVGARIPYRELLSQRRAELWRKTIDPNASSPRGRSPSPATAIRRRRAHDALHDRRRRRQRRLLHDQPRRELRQRLSRPGARLLPQ